MKNIKKKKNIVGISLNYIFIWLWARENIETDRNWSFSSIVASIDMNKDFVLIDWLGSDIEFYLYVNKNRRVKRRMKLEVTKKNDINLLKYIIWFSLHFYPAILLN